LARKINSADGGTEIEGVLDFRGPYSFFWLGKNGRDGESGYSKVLHFS